MSYTIIEKTKYAGKIDRLYNGLAKVYDLFTDHEPAIHGKAVQRAGIKGSEKILEVACGTGNATGLLAKALQRNGKLYTIDISRGMLDKAKEKLQKQGLSEKVEFRLGNATKLPFPNETFDILYNGYMFDLFNANEFPRVINEFKRVLKPGGKLILVNMSKRTNKKTLYELLYERGLLGFASGGCRPIIMKPYLQKEGFEQVERSYHTNKSWFPLNWLTGTEIVVGYKSQSNQA